MLGLSPATRVYVATGAVDMRKGFEGLFGIVRDTLSLDPLSGHLFLFANKPRTRLKILFWDGSGFWVCAKRLEKGRFAWPRGDGESLRLRGDELAMLLGGLDWSAAKRRRGWLRLESTDANIS
jgi:transposase